MINDLIVIDLVLDLFSFDLNLNLILVIFVKGYDLGCFIFGGIMVVDIG